MIGMIEILMLLGVVFVALPLLGLGLFAGFVHRRRGISKGQTEELAEIRDTINALRDELRDVRADIADITLSMRDAERRSLTGDETSSTRR